MFHFFQIDVDMNLNLLPNLKDTYYTFVNNFPIHDVSCTGDPEGDADTVRKVPVQPPQTAQQCEGQ